MYYTAKFWAFPSFTLSPILTTHPKNSLVLPVAGLWLTDWLGASEVACDGCCVRNSDGVSWGSVSVPDRHFRTFGGQHETVKNSVPDPRGPSGAISVLRTLAAASPVIVVRSWCCGLVRSGQ